MFVATGDGESGVVRVDRNAEKFDRRVKDSVGDFAVMMEGLDKGEKEVKILGGRMKSCR